MAPAFEEGMRKTIPRSLVLLITIGVAMRLVLVATGAAPERFEYDDLARNLLSGRGYVYDQLGTAYHSFYAGLAYIVANTATDWLFPTHPSAMLVTQSLFAGALGVVVFQIARRFGSELFALTAVALVLCHPAFVYYDTHKLHPLGFDSLAMVAAVWALMRLREDGRPSAAAATGVLMGFAILQRGSMALFFVASLGWLAVVLARRRGGWAIAAVYVAGMLLVLAPWAARNYAIHGMVMLESMTPQQVWKGNATYSNGSGYLPSGRSVYDAAPPRLVAEWQRRDETGQFRLFREESAAEVRKDPARAAGLVLKKFWYFWTFPPNSGQAYPARFFGLYLAYYALMVLTAATGVAAAFKQSAQRPDVVLVVIYLASLSIVHALLFVEMRHRWAAEPLMLVFVPAGIQAIMARAGWRDANAAGSRS